MYPRSLLAAALVLLAFVIGSYALTQLVWGKDIPMGHPSLSMSLRAGPDSRFDFFPVDENSIEKLRDDMTNKLYVTIDTIVLPEIKKQFDEKKDIYSNGYIEYISINYDANESHLEIFIAKQPSEYGCNTERCAIQKVDVVIPPELKLSEIRQIGMFIAVYDTPSEQLIERIQTKTSGEARILLTEASDVLEEKKDELLADNTQIESFFLRQYEDISRTTVMFSPFEPGGPAKEPIDVVDTSNTYYKRASSLPSESESPETSEGWATAFISGNFLNSEPPKPDQIFKLYYRAINGTVDTFTVNSTIMTKMNGTGSLDVRFPRNYPYTNSNEGAGSFRIQDLANPDRLIDAKRSTTDCFFELSIPFGDKSQIEISWAYLLWNKPYHGDIVPNYCISQTTVQPSQERLDECSKLGISQDKCNDITLLQRASMQDEERKRLEYEQNQLNSAYYLIGIGGVVAGIMAFVTLRKK